VTCFQFPSTRSQFMSLSSRVWISALGAQYPEQRCSDATVAVSFQIRATGLRSPEKKGEPGLVGFPGNQPPTLFRKARAVKAFQLDPPFLDRIDDRISGSAVDAGQHPPSPGLPIRRDVDLPHNMLS